MSFCSSTFTVTLQHCRHTPHMRSDFRADDPTGTPLLHYSYRIDLWPLNKYRGTKSWQPDRSIQTPANINAHWTDCHMTPCVYHKQHNPHLGEKKKNHLTWNVSGFLTCRKTFKMCHVVRRPRSHRRCLVRGAVKIKTWLEMWIPKLRLNLGPIISAPAAKGNFSTSPHDSHHLWGFGVMETHSRHASPQVRQGV